MGEVGGGGMYGGGFTSTHLTPKATTDLLKPTSNSIQIHCTFGSTESRVVKYF